jgi:hypothetical protein
MLMDEDKLSNVGSKAQIVVLMVTLTIWHIARNAIYIWFIAELRAQSETHFLKKSINLQNVTWELE